MTYPEKTCTIDRLVTNERMVEAVLAGRKVEQRRNGVYAYPGETFDLEGRRFEVTRVVRQRLGDMTDEDAVREGFSGMDVYRSIILRMHAGMSWDEDHRVWLHAFREAGDGMGVGPVGSPEKAVS